MDARALLEAKTKEELIDEILERRQEADDREVDVAGAEAALSLEEGEANKYALMAATSDFLVNWLMVNGVFKEEIPDDIRGKINVAIDRHVERAIALAARKKS